MRIKISGKTVQSFARMISKNAPDLLSKASKTITPVLKNAGSYAKTVVDFIKRNPGKVTAGVIGTGVVVDDIHQHYINKVQRDGFAKREAETTSALRKHEAEIQSLKVKADKVEDLEIINEQLCQVVKEAKKGGPDEEKEVHEDGTTD